MNQLQIRGIDLANDLEKIVDLSVGRDDLHPIEEMERHVRQPYFDPQGFLVAEKDGEIIGYAEGHLGYWQIDTITDTEVLKDDSEIGCIERILVHEKHRRKGIGTTLMKSVLEYLKSRGAKAVVVGALVSKEKEIAAKRLYEKFGFREIHTWKSRDYGEMKMLMVFLV
jgi:GNAT superfamily N-acetyltransferase